MANEPEAASPADKPAVKKLLYKSPLSSIRSAPYKPPVDKSGFKPIGVSSPKRQNNAEGDRFAITVQGPQQNKPPKIENERFSNRGPDIGPSQQPTGDNVAPSLHPSLGGRGGHWRAPHGNMTPDNRRRGNKHQGYNSSPNVEGKIQWFSPVQNLDSPNSLDRSSSEASFGQNSFRQKSFGTHSFSSTPRTPNSPYGQFNSSNNSSHNNSKRKNRGGAHGSRSNGGIEVFYSPSMKEDPWSGLMRERMNTSMSQSRTPAKTMMNLTSDSELDEGISSQGNDTPAGDDSC